MPKDIGLIFGMSVNHDAYIAEIMGFGFLKIPVIQIFFLYAVVYWSDYLILILDSDLYSNSFSTITNKL